MNQPNDQPVDSDDIPDIRELAINTDLPVVDTDIRIEIDRSARQQARHQRDDDRFLIRFFAVCIFMIGLTTIVPSLYQWIEISQADAIQSIPRWVYVLGFAGSLHLLYSLLLYQVEDYSALQSLAVFLLVVTCAYGFVGVTLWLGDANGPVPRFLQLPSVLRPRAAIWCGIMFGISALGCYLLGREAIIFRRRHLAGRL